MTADAPNNERWTACESCGMSYEDCTNRMVAREAVCCSRCAYTDTHNDRPVPVPSPVPPRPDTASGRPPGVERIWERLCHAESAIGHDRPSPPTWDDIDVLFHYADAHPVTDQGPDLSDLRAAREYAESVSLKYGLNADFGLSIDAVSRLCDAVDRLLADRGDS